MQSNNDSKPSQKSENNGRNLNEIPTKVIIANPKLIHCNEKINTNLFSVPIQNYSTPIKGFHETTLSQDKSKRTPTKFSIQEVQLFRKII